MADKRMFSKKVTDNDEFIKLSSSAQALYFHLNQGADDDGFNNQVELAMFKSHASSDDLIALLGKKFLLRFESGVVVIKHWWMHNTLRKDRYKTTNYQNELKALGVKDNGSYTLLESKNKVGCHLVAKVVTQNRLDKNSIDKNNINTMVKSEDVDLDIDPCLEGQSSSLKRTKNEIDFDTLWALYPRKQGKKNAYQLYLSAIKQGATYNEIKQGIENYVAYIKKNNIDMQYVKQGKTWFSQRSWQDDYSISYSTRFDNKKVKESPEWLKEYEEEHKNIKAKELSEEEAQKVLSNAQEMFKTKVPEKLNEGEK